MSQFNAPTLELFQNYPAIGGWNSMNDRSGAGGGRYLLLLQNSIFAADISEEILLREPHAEVSTLGTRAELMAALSQHHAPSGVFLELERLGAQWTIVREGLAAMGTRIVLLGAAAEEMAERDIALPGIRLLLRPYAAADIAAALGARGSRA